VELEQVYNISKLGENVPEWAEEVKYKFVDEVMGDKLPLAEKWIKELEGEMEVVKEKLGLRDFLLSKELRSFMEDPRRHLVKKLFLYFHDLVRGRITPEEFATKGRQAINSSFGSNLRGIYQSWGLLATLELLADRGFSLAYPPHKVVGLDRAGMQKGGSIPPNAVVEDGLGRSFSFFVEAPRPIGWEDGGDLEKVWKLYSTLRPDMLIYKGFYHDIVDLSNDIPIKRPNYVVEFKELDDWWKRWRYLKGYKPFSANEWRARWIKGLYDGLAEVLGGKREEGLPEFKKEEGKKIREYKVIELYMGIYKPDLGVLISRRAVEDEVKEDLKGVMVLDDVGFNKEKLYPLVEDMLRGLEVKLDLRELAYKFAMEREREFRQWLREKLGVELNDENDESLKD